MRRIKATGCGYSLDPGRSYTCNGLPKLKSSFGTTNMDTATKTDWLSVIDNYNNVPQQIEGFIMTLTPILDMSGGSANNIEVPELDCRVNFDPFMDMPGSVLKTEAGYTSIEATQDTGFVDMFDNGPGIRPNTKYRDDVYVDVNGSTYNVFIGPAGPAFLPSFTTNGTSYIMRPGILEPMVDTTFTPISIDVNPPTFDGTNTAIAILNKWRVEADKRFRDIYNKIRPWSYDDSDVKGLAGLQNALNKEGPCDNFAITIITGTPLIRLESGGSHSSPSYSVDAGTIKINGSTVTIPAISAAVNAPFKAYLDVVGNTASIQTATHVPLSSNGHTYVYIGEVREIKNNQESASHDSLFGDGSILSLYQIIQGDCITEINTGTGGSGRGYEGPFMVSLAGSTVYLHKGDEIPATTDVVGGPTNTDIEHPQTAARDYSANIYSITDGAHSIPCDSNDQCYAGYSIITGLSYDEEPTYTFKVDEGTDASVYMLYTRSGDSWSGSYQQRPGTSAPATDMVEINGVSMEASAVRIGAVIGGTTGPGGQLVGGATVTSIDGSTDTKARATNGSKIETMVAGATASTSYDVPDRYLVPIGHVSGGAIGQIQYGDIFIDVQNIPEPEPGPGGDTTYTGPFHVIDDANSPSGFSVKGISSDHTSSDEPAAGMIYYNGADLNTVEAAYVAGSSKLTSGSVYAHIILTKNGSGNYVATLGAYNTSDSYTASEGTVYSIRLAEITGSTTAKQIHYGDIYLFGDESASGYSGPFTVTVAGGTFAITCAACGNDDDNHPIIGWYSVNGQGDTAITGPYTGAASANGYVFFHYSAEGAEINTNPSQSGPSDYVVRLARVTGGVASQLHYGNIHITGRWS